MVALNYHFARETMIMKHNLLRLLLRLLRIVTEGSQPLLARFLRYLFVTPVSAAACRRTHQPSISPAVLIAAPRIHVSRAE